MTVLMVLWSIVGCDNSAAERLRTCAGGNTEACYKDGMSAVNAAKPRFGEARKAFAAACHPSVGSPGAGSQVSKHDPRACNQLALLVHDAKGGPKDVPRAIELFESACKDGIDRACVDLALLLYSDTPEEAPNAARAVVLFEDACAKVNLTALPVEGEAPAPVEQPQASAGCNAWRKAPVKGPSRASDTPPTHVLAEACDALGHAYQAGIGVEPLVKDEEKAATLFSKACEARYAKGCVSAGALVAEGKKKEDIEAAAVFYERGCRLDARLGCFELAELHAKKAWPGATDAQAAVFYQKTCNIDPTRGCFEAGELMEEGRVAAREGEIESLYNLACEHGHTLACSRRALK